MLWRSKDKAVQATGGSKILVSTIPMDFYAGQNPVIKFRTIEKTVGNYVPPVKVKPPVPKAAGMAENAVGLLSNRKFLIFGSVGLFAIFLGGTGIYYWWLSGRGQIASKPPVTKVTPSVVPPSVVAVPTSTAPAETAVSMPPTTTTTTTLASLSGGLIEFPSILLGDSADMDRDGLTDVEEELFGTDPGKPDTDGDSYNDGTEIFYLYSPTDFAPARLIATPYVKEFLNPVYKYKLYYPSSWAVGNVDPDYRDMLFSTLSGENIEVRVFDRKPEETFEDWFTANATGEKLGSLVDFITIFAGSGKMRNDKLVYYFSDKEHFYVIVYHVTNSTEVNYRAVIGMMARSFRNSSESNAILPNLEMVIPTSTVVTSSVR